MQKFIRHLRFSASFFERRLVFMAGPESPGEGNENKKPQNAPKESVDLDNENTPDNAKFAEQFKKDFADKIKDNQMVVDHVQDNVTYRYTFEIKKGEVKIQIKKVNVSEQKEKGETNPISTEITFSRLYSGKIFGMPEVPKVLEENKAQPAQPTLDDVGKKISEAKNFDEFKKSLGNTPDNMLSEATFQKVLADYFKKVPSTDKAQADQVSQWVTGTQYQGNPAKFVQDLDSGKVLVDDMRKIFENANIPVAKNKEKQGSPEAGSEQLLGKEQAEQQMTEKVNAILAKYETMDPKIFTGTYKTVEQLLAVAAKEVNDFNTDFAKKVDPKAPAEVRIKGFHISTKGSGFSIADVSNMNETNAYDWAHRVFLDRSEAIRSPDDYKECSTLMQRMTDCVNGEGITSLESKIANGSIDTLEKFKAEINTMFDTFISKKLKASDYSPKGRDMNMWISLKGVPVQVMFKQNGNISWSYKGFENALAYRFLVGTTDSNSNLAKTLKFDDKSLVERANQFAEAQRLTRNLAISAWADSFRGVAYSLDIFKKGDGLDFNAIDAKLVQNVEGILAKYRYDRNLLKGFGFGLNDYNFDFKGERYNYHFRFDENGKLLIDHTKEKTMNKDLAEAATKQKMQDFFKKYQDMPPKEFAGKFKSNDEFYKQFLVDVGSFTDSYALAERDQKLYVAMNGFHVEKTAGSSSIGYDNDSFYQQKKKAAA